MAHHLYQGFTEPLEITPPLAPLTWAPKYPDRCPAAPRLLAAIVAGAIFFQPILTPSENTGGAPGIGQVFAAPQVQYQSQVAPFPAAYAQQTPTIDGWGQPPSQPYLTPSRLPSLLAGGVWTPEHTAAEGSALDWTPGYPERIPVAPRLPVYPAFVLDPYPIPTVEAVTYAAAYYPDRIDRRDVRPVDQLAFVEPRYLPIFDLRWQAQYPDRIWARARTVDYLSVVTGQTGSTIPYSDLRWQGTFPDRVYRARPDAGWPVVVLDPFPRPNEPAPVLSWQGSYPNWINRAVVIVALQPFTDVRNLDPIPNEPAEGGQTTITLGVEIGVTDFPVLGGWIPY